MIEKFIGKRQCDVYYFTLGISTAAIKIPTMGDFRRYYHDFTALKRVRSISNKFYT